MKNQGMTTRKVRTTVKSSKAMKRFNMQNLLVALADEENLDSQLCAQLKWNDYVNELTQLILRS